MAKVLKPGFNDPNWTMEVVCESSIGRGGQNEGCGATIEVTKADLFTVHEHDMGGPRREVRYNCGCGNQVNLGRANKFNFKEPLPAR